MGKQGQAQKKLRIARHAGLAPLASAVGLASLALAVGLASLASAEEERGNVREPTQRVQDNMQRNKARESKGKQGNAGESEVKQGQAKQNCK